MSDDLTQLPLPPVTGGWKAWAAWGLSATVATWPAVRLVLAKLKERKAAKAEILTRLAELDKKCLRKGDFELKIANLMEMVNLGRSETKEGNARIEYRQDYILARLDAHIDNRPFKAPVKLPPATATE